MEGIQCLISPIIQRVQYWVYCGARVEDGFKDGEGCAIEMLHIFLLYVMQICSRCFTFFCLVMQRVCTLKVYRRNIFGGWYTYFWCMIHIFLGSIA